MPRFVDLSIRLEYDVLSDPPMLAPKIGLQKHETLPEFMALLPGAQTDGFPDHESAIADWVAAISESSTCAG